MNTKRPRVLIVVPSSAKRGGGDIWLSQLIRSIDHPSLDLLIVFETDGELIEIASEAGHRTATLGRNGPPSNADLIHLVRPLARILSQERPHLTIHWSPRAQIYGTLAQRMSRIFGPSAWVQHVIPSRFWLHRAANALPTEAVVCVSTAVALQQLLLYPQRRTVVIHPGVNYQSIEIDKVASRSALGVPLDVPLIGIVGRVEPWKGQDIFLRAMHRLREHGLMLHGLIVGEPRSPTWPAFADEVLELMTELELQQQVTFTGHLTSPSLAYAAMDVLVCASREEGFGLAVVEAMAAGIPVVATRCGGPQEVVSDGKNGLLVPEEDPDALVAAIARLVSDHSFASRIAEAAKETYQNRFTAQRGTERFLGIVEQLCYKK